MILDDIPKPDVHIPLKRLEKSTWKSPYGKGDDNHDVSNVTIVQSTSRISRDQFGKENALHLFNDYLNIPAFIYGNFLETPIG